MVNSTSRSANACEACRRRKVKCSGDQPCRACLKHKWDCNFGHSGRKRFSEAQVQNLLEKIRVYEERLADKPPGTSSLSPDAAGSGPSRVPQQAEVETPANSGPRNQPGEFGYDGSVDGISPATDLTSGPAFETQVKSLLDRSQSRIFSARDHPRGRGQQNLPSQWAAVDPLLENKDESLPSLEQSQHLLDQFLFYLGVSQHFFDSRTFSDSLMLLFQSPFTREEVKRSAWYTEYLLVMAMAKLMDVETPSPHPPGSTLFAEALRRLPPLHHLGGEGIIAVEILTLITTYLQWCDRKHDAYLYIGLALRLAIALGCNLPENEQNCLPSQSAHRVRLWWTVYMLDRRLSSGLGLAAGADERQLRAGYPQHAAGFQSPVALTINVRIARITDEIMSSLYGNAAITQLDLVRKIQAILQELYEIGRSFPQSLVLDFNRPLGTVTRTGSSLYLMLFQAIILCTRPILLRSVRLEVRRQQTSEPPEAVPEVLVRLCETCNEAAVRSLAILHSLQRQQTIPRYGFFDLDATFSAAFVLVMVGFIDNSQNKPPAALSQAYDVLRFLSRSGNSAAEQRLQDISQSCSHVWPDHIFDRASSSPNTSPQSNLVPRLGEDPTLDANRRGGTIGQTSVPPPDYMAVFPESRHRLYDESRLLEPWVNATANTGFGMQGDWDIDLSGEAEDIYSSFQDPTLPLTGVDYMDWLEIEKILNGPGGA
ncbi:hypothetical protein N7532_002776 [Penicillium argentinense]|uniref:Zn(2)-C6 fungal-type domain-containing protein n=1 Tax=Penicillium argentinense TaxID=1131581 RepID=A0A9W9KLJ1_9EURO|nr:uncharacterized protein N7532_002776 [Penicillium argentinense]KAJ5110131.1 hypothetical protein N7532_002776 [Penicillium argentinense]